MMNKEVLARNPQRGDYHCAIVVDQVCFSMKYFQFSVGDTVFLGKGPQFKAVRYCNWGGGGVRH